MDFSPSVPARSEAIKLRPKRSTVSSFSSSVAGSLGVNDVQAAQDDKASKKQRRMEANRMSALRSRLRKQALHDELKEKVEALSNENQNLRNELHRLSEECKKLNSENNSMKEEIMKFYVPDVIPKE